MNLRAQVRRTIDQDDVVELEELVAAEPRAVRHLLGLSYLADETLRKRAARGIAIASRYHPNLVQALVRRLVWAMNDESGTNALSAPVVVQAVAGEDPELLIPMVPDLIRLAADEGLREGLGEALRVVSKKCPGKVGIELQRSLNEMLLGGDCNAR